MRHLTFHPAFRAQVQSSSRIHAKKPELFKPLPSGGAKDHVSFDHVDNLLLILQML